MLKCHDLHLTRGCHIRRCGLSDLSPSNTAAPWFLSDKCGSLGLTKMNVLVYKKSAKRHSWGACEPGPEARYTSGWLPNTSSWPQAIEGRGEAKPLPPAKNRSPKSLSVGTVRSGSFSHNHLRVNQVLEVGGSTVYTRHPQPVSIWATATTHIQ